MTGSRLNPRVSRKTGEEESGGYIKRVDGQKSATSPDWRGMFYLVGYGWIWLSGWDHDSDGEPLIRLLSQDMTDEKAQRFCTPKERRGGKTPARRQAHQQNGKNPPPSDDPEIPF